MLAEPGARIWTGLNPCGLSDLDVAAGVVLGCDGLKDLDPGRERDISPVEVLRNAARRMLEAGPCLVAFSGGRDSSALLALFTEVARRFELPEPVAVTMRWVDDASSDESEWQEQVVRSIGVKEWEVIQGAEDLDLLGSEATDALTTYGLLWPPPAYVLRPMLRRAAGGTLVSGEGGDEAFGLWPYARAWAMLSHRRVPPVRELIALAAGFAPMSVRRTLWKWRDPPYQDWLAPSARRVYARELATEMATDPVWWDDYLVVVRKRRSVTLGRDVMARLAHGEGAKFVAPFQDPTFLDALGQLGRRRGLGGRTSVMTALFGDLLPLPVVTRITKATFGGVFWGPSSRQFARSWSGAGIDPHLVDAERLRSAWLAPTPVFGSALPLHAAWLKTQSG